MSINCSPDGRSDRAHHYAIWPNTRARRCRSALLEELLSATAPAPYRSWVQFRPAPTDLKRRAPAGSTAAAADFIDVVEHVRWILEHAIGAGFEKLVLSVTA